MKRLILVAAATFAVTTLSVPAFASATHGLKQVHDPKHVTGTITGRCYYGDRGQLPDPRCTPGSVDPAVTQADLYSTICKSGYTAKVRPPYAQTEPFKYDVAYPHYGTPQADRSELDHLVPLELGGSNDATNLWPEVGLPSGNPKDYVENALNAAVCEGRVSLVAAQDAIARDWLTAEKTLGIAGVVTGGGGSGGGGKAWCKASASPSTDGYAGDYDVHITSDQPGREATASDTGDTWSHDTGSTGAATITLWHTSPGETIRVTVGGASCSTRA